MHIRGWRAIEPMEVVETVEAHGKLIVQRQLDVDPLNIASHNLSEGF